MNSVLERSKTCTCLVCFLDTLLGWSLYISLVSYFMAHADRRILQLLVCHSKHFKTPSQQGSLCWFPTSWPMLIGGVSNFCMSWKTRFQQGAQARCGYLCQRSYSTMGEARPDQSCVPASTLSWWWNYVWLSFRFSCWLTVGVSLQESRIMSWHDWCLNVQSTCVCVCAGLKTTSTALPEMAIWISSPGGEL